MKISLTKRLFIGFLGVILLTCTLSGAVGLGLLDRSIVNRIQERVQLDLRLAHGLFEDEMARIREPIRISALNFSNHDVDAVADIAGLKPGLDRIADRESFDILTLMNHDGENVKGFPVGDAIQTGNPLTFSPL